MWTTASRTERTTSRVDADAIVVGAGLAGLVATAELADAGRQVLLLDQENEANLGGQAFWSLGGLFLVDSPEQRRMGVHDSLDLAWQDWEGTAGFDREREDRRRGEHLHEEDAALQTLRDDTRLRRLRRLHPNHGLSVATCPTANPSDTITRRAVMRR